NARCSLSTRPSTSSRPRRSRLRAAPRMVVAPAIDEDSSHFHASGGQVAAPLGSVTPLFALLPHPHPRGLFHCVSYVLTYLNFGGRLVASVGAQALPTAGDQCH